MSVSFCRRFGLSVNGYGNGDGDADDIAVAQTTANKPLFTFKKKREQKSIAPIEIK